jgi:ubiquinone/menaquinone biosynthesis C-methylase UbiE
LSSSETLPTPLGKDDVRRIYGKLAPAYDLWANLTETKARAACLARAAIRDGESVLEVAVGTGLAFVEIVRANPHGRNEGIDLTSPMLERARARLDKAALGARYQLALGDAYALQFPDASFDVLINNYMFDLLPEQDFTIVLGEFRRVLKPNGRLAMVNMTGGARWWQNIPQWIYRLSPAWMGGCRAVALSSHLERAGFVNIERELIAQFGFPSEVISARKG